MAETLDIIKQLCKEKGISISQLEKDLDYGNGSLTKPKAISSDRLYKIARYFDVQMEYLITGKTISEAEDEMALLRQQQSILLSINKTSQLIADYYKKIAACQEDLNALRIEFSKIEKKMKNPKPLVDYDGFINIPDDPDDSEGFDDFIDDEKPFE